MKTYKDVPQPYEVGVTCDRCGFEAANTDAEFSEFVTIIGKGGYFSSQWGDLTKWEVDLCEKCSFELFGTIARRSEYPL